MTHTAIQILGSALTACEPKLHERSAHQRSVVPELARRVLKEDQVARPNLGDAGFATIYLNFDG